MIIGGIITLAGFGIGSLVTNIDAQNEVGVFDTIYTKHIRVSTSLVLCHWLSDGYNLLSLIRASCVVNRHLTVARC